MVINCLGQQASGKCNLQGCRAAWCQAGTKQPCIPLAMQAASLSETNHTYRASRSLKHQPKASQTHSDHQN